MNGVTSGASALPCTALILVSMGVTRLGSMGLKIPRERERERG